MTETEFEILKNRCIGRITQEEVDAAIPWRKTKTELEELLDNCLAKGNPNNIFEIYFWSTPTDMSNEEEQELYRKYLLTEGHYEHEEIASAFQTRHNLSGDNVKVLVEAIIHPPKYLQAEDFRYPYIRKCIYAIGVQPEPHNFLGLNKLAVMDDFQIKELALHQINKRQNKGYWEKATK